MQSDLAALAFRAYLIAQWIFLSSCIILFNKHLLSEAGFPYPMTLVLCHMLFITAAAAGWKYAGWVEVPEVSREDLIKRLVPIAACFALSISLGNYAYLYISVAFVQMLKATTPVAVLFVSFALGLEKPSCRLFVYIVLIATGILVACVSNVELHVVGLLVQCAAVVAEAVRLGLVQLTLNGRYSFSPVAFLYYIAPLCAAAMLVPWALIEMPAVARHHGAAFRRIGAPLLLANASVAFLLNLATMALIKHTSALTLNVSGVFKDLLLISWSVLVSGAVVAPLQWAGYGVAMIGVLGYSHYKRTEAARREAEKATAGLAAAERGEVEGEGEALAPSPRVGDDWQGVPGPDPDDESDES